jgi:hypothetical protein
MNLHLLVLKADRYFGERQSLRTAHLTAFQKVVVADVIQQAGEDRAHLRTLAVIVFDALEEHEERCLICGTERDAREQLRNAFRRLAVRTKDS